MDPNERWLKVKDGERKGNNIDWHQQITKFMKILNKVRKGKKACLTDLIFFWHILFENTYAAKNGLIIYQLAKDCGH